MARSGHVYCLQADVRNLKRTEGSPVPDLIGIGQASTFTGLCKHHDNALFAPLEKVRFRGTAEQCFLLAYRAVLRELYLKRRFSTPVPELIDALESQPEPLRSALRRLHDNVVEGNRLGLQVIERQAANMKEMAGARCYDDIRYLIIHFDRVPTLMASTAWCPTSDFDGKALPNLHLIGRPGASPDVVTISIFATHGGGAAVLAWHRSSDKACTRFAASLARQRSASLTDCLVRLSFQTSENIYMHADWWEQLPGNTAALLLARSAEGMDPLRGFCADDLISRDEQIPSWGARAAAIRVTHEGRLLETSEALRDLLEANVPEPPTT